MILMMKQTCVSGWRLLPFIYFSGYVYMRESMYDTITTSRKVEYQNTCLTMTYISGWPAIKDVLQPRQNVIKQPDLDMLIFQETFRGLMAFLSMK